MTIAVITGGAGRIASAVRPHLREAGWSVRLLDTRPPETELAPTERGFIGSVFDDSLLLESFAGADLVVHLAAHPAERPWEEILSLNIDGTQRVFTAAHHAGVRRVLFASSIHAVGFEPFETLGRADRLVPRPDTYYGASKAAGEALAALFADRFGMSVVSARIGNASMRLDEFPQRITWLSSADAARLIIAVGALDEPGHHIVWGVSRGAEDYIPLEPGRRIGYHPEDDARLPEDAGTSLTGPAGRTFIEIPLGEPL